MNCENCNVDYPEEILAPLNTSAGHDSIVCGICALEIINKLHGIARDKFHGGNAENMRLAAIEHRKKAGISA